MKGNLGTYQEMTVLAKMVGGPESLLIITVLLGAAIYKGSELGVKACLKAIKKKKKYSQYKKVYFDDEQLSKCTEKLQFVVNGRFEVIDSVGEFALIKKKGEKSNSYVISKELLQAVSDYEYSKY